MGWQDRHYNRDDDPRQSAWGGGGFGSGGFGSGSGGGGFGSGFSWSSFTGWLIILNVAVFFFDLMLGQSSKTTGALTQWGHFSFATAISQGQVWRFISYQFLHANTLHLFFNMLALFFFGPMIERHLGSRRYIAFYLLCGIAGAIMYLLLFASGFLLTNPASRMVGASAGIFGILAGAAVIAPNARVMLIFPPIPMKLRTMALVFLGIAAFTILTQGQNAGGEAAHLGGAIAGFLLIKRANLLNFANRIGQAIGPVSHGDAPGTPGSRDPLTPDRKGFNTKVSDYLSEREKKKQAQQDAEIDRILAKVKDHGLQSLTDAEKKTLQQETRRQQGR